MNAFTEQRHCSMTDIDGVILRTPNITDSFDSNNPAATQFQFTVKETKLLVVTIQLFLSKC